MLRGSGVRGMCGIPPVRDIYYRPLIAVAKSDILALLDIFEIPYAVDETNSSTDYSRNYVRHNLLPHFEKINPAFDKSVARLTDHMRAASDLIASLSSGAYDAISDATEFSVSHLRDLHPAVRADLIARIVYDRTGDHPDEMHINDIADKISLDNFRVSLRSADFVCQRGICFFDFRGEKREEDVIFHLKLGENKIQGSNLTVYLELGPDFNVFSPNIYKYSIYMDLDGAIIDNSVYLRTRRDGDSYRYNGMTRRLKKVFNDYGIPPFMRDGIPVICDRDGILWVVGLPVRDGARPLSKASTLRITVLFDDSDGHTFYPARKFNDANI
jgi:tRNA(Ile)-lysidine synthase